jgi:hypothetical protein
MVLAIVLLASLAFATVREMLLRPIPIALGLACLFGLVKADAGPLIAFGAPLFAYALAGVVQEALLNAQVPAVRFGAMAACGGASLWVLAQLVQGALQLKS